MQWIASIQKNHSEKEIRKTTEKNSKNTLQVRLFLSLRTQFFHRKQFQFEKNDDGNWAEESIQKMSQKCVFYQKQVFWTFWPQNTAC